MLPASDALLAAIPRWAGRFSPSPGVIAPGFSWPSRANPPPVPPKSECLPCPPGYQLLMLNDFTGQSEALVGILDPFWESKGVVTAAEVRAWNAPTVVLARFAKFVWTADETFVARLEAAYYGEQALPAGTVQWELRDSQGRDLARGQLDVHAVPTGGVTPLGAITVPLENIREPIEARLTVRFAGSENHWCLWVYPPADVEPEPAGVLVTRTFDDAAIQTLKSGGKVLLLAHGVKNPYAMPRCVISLSPPWRNWTSSSRQVRAGRDEDACCSRLSSARPRLHHTA